MQRGKLPFGWIRIDYRMRSSFTTGNMYSRFQIFYVLLSQVLRELVGLIPDLKLLL